jgi:hypothetical protein
MNQATHLSDGPAVLRSARANLSRSPFAVAVAGVLLVLAWQWATVHANYAGNWSALFRTSIDQPPIPNAQDEQLYRFEGGFDGQMYHALAHDPWMSHATAEAIDSPKYRAGRLLVPLAAFLLSGGQHAWIDAAYRLVILIFVGLGSRWTALICQRVGRSPWLGLAFLASPATIVSADSMVTDVALTAFTVGFAYHATRNASGYAPQLMLALAALTRDTGLLLAGGYFVYLGVSRQYKAAAATVVAIVPTIAWLAILEMRYSEGTRGQGSPGLREIAVRLSQPRDFSFLPTAQAVVANIFDIAALLGALAVLLIPFVLLSRQRGAGPLPWVASVFALFFLIGPTPGDMWDAPYSYGRVLAPLLLLVAYPADKRWTWWMILPSVLIAVRLALNFLPQAAGVLRFLLP